MRSINISQKPIVSSMEYGTMTVGKVGNRNIPIKMLGKNTPLMIQMPFLWTFGVDAKAFDDGKEKKSMNLMFPNEKYETPQTVAAIQHLKEFETHILETAVLNSLEWIKKKPNKDVAEAMFTKFLKYKKNPATLEPDLSQPPYMNVKIPEYKGKVEVDVFDEAGKSLYVAGCGEDIMDIIPKNANVMCLLKCNGVWFGGTGNFGVSFQVAQVVIKENKRLPRGVCIMTDDDGVPLSKTSKLENAPAAEEPTPRAEASTEVHSEDEFVDPDPTANPTSYEEGSVPVKSKKTKNTVSKR
jgi:hypothetical protein